MSTTYTPEMALKVLQDNPLVHYGGFGQQQGYGGTIDLAERRKEILRPESLAVIAAVAEWCTDRKPRGLSTRSSYGLKHDAACDLGTQVSNGQCIAGMLLAGYRIRELGYNVTFRSPA